MLEFEEHLLGGGGGDGHEEQNCSAGQCDSPQRYRLCAVETQTAPFGLLKKKSRPPPLPNAGMLIEHTQ